MSFLKHRCRRCGASEHQEIQFRVVSRAPTEESYRFHVEVEIYHVYWKKCMNTFYFCVGHRFHFQFSSGVWLDASWTCPRCVFPPADSGSSEANKFIVGIRIRRNTFEFHSFCLAIGLNFILFIITATKPQSVPTGLLQSERSATAWLKHCCHVHISIA